MGARAEDCLDAVIIKKLVILLRDHPAADHQDILRPGSLERGNQFRREGLVPRCLTGDADHMDIVVNRILRRFLDLSTAEVAAGEGLGGYSI